MNNKKRNRKGFTIVELSIVIAVIAILAAALIPTFGGIIEKSQATKLQQELDNAYAEYVLEAGANVSEDVVIIHNGVKYVFEDGAPKADSNEDDGWAKKASPEAGTDIVYCADDNKLWVTTTDSTSGVILWDTAKNCTH